MYALNKHTPRSNEV